MNSFVIIKEKINEIKKKVIDNKLIKKCKNKIQKFINTLWKNTKKISIIKSKIDIKDPKRIFWIELGIGCVLAVLVGFLMFKYINTEPSFVTFTILVVALFCGYVLTKFVEEISQFIFGIFVGYKLKAIKIIMFFWFFNDKKIEFNKVNFKQYKKFDFSFEMKPPSDIKKVIIPVIYKKISFISNFVVGLAILLIGLIAKESNNDLRIFLCTLGFMGMMIVLAKLFQNYIEENKSL